MDISQILAIVIPLLLIQLTLIVIALVDLMRPERRVRGGNKVVWGVIIVVGELLGPLLYFVVGRETE